jgi:uncharacterized protein YdhG (YjbR/CyaY superfamily)
MKTSKSVFKTVDEYIDSFPADIRKKLDVIRKTIKKTAPDAGESISYNMPAYKQNGPLVYFAVFKSHIGLYPGTIKLPLDEPIEVKVISDLVKHQLQRNKK